MKQSVKTIVDSIEKEINTILENSEKQDYGLEKEFEFGSFVYDVSYNLANNKYLDDWDYRDSIVEITPKSATVTNENNKILTNLSVEVFNQLETTYTNY